MRRVLLFVVAALLAFPVGGEWVYGRMAESRTTVTAGGAEAVRGGVRAAVASYAYEDGGPADPEDPAAERCPTGRAARTARSTAGVPVSRPGGRTRCTSDPTVPPAERPSPTAPVTGNRAVPLTRSGQLPVSHHAFRC
ncbi:hypothetical protein CP973_37325 [Streptomyces albofaciens JCM 4342]|uniref:hypothetical protein n=1 Tax=Streptomyces albofaciens TaxID=66866 RepID=UPI001238F46A|nr:hypothetical protein [Streptomyces albofaciens]KAA6214715.1 hypothetical protein CP973_37325 [Streptomyces albofaciens JCM 4342]